MTAPRAAPSPAGSRRDPSAPSRGRAPSEGDFSWPDVGDVLSATPAVGRPPFRVAPLAGGLTNHNYRATDRGGRDVVVRLSSPQSGVLTIDRESEYRNAAAAAGAGVAPRVLGHQPAHGAMVIEWIEGRTLSSADLDDVRMLERVAQACRVLHDGCRFGNEFDMFAVQERYLRVVRSQGYRLPARYLDFLPQVDRIRSALAVLDEGTVACHNDLLAANIMDDGERLWLIDFEYSGNNDPCFELGNIWSEASLGPDRLGDLVSAYFGAPSPEKVARARLLGLMSKYGWTLWASIQEAISDVDFDFWSWGMEKYERAVADFDSPDFDRWIEQVQIPTLTGPLAPRSPTRMAAEPG